MNILVVNILVLFSMLVMGTHVSAFPRHHTRSVLRPPPSQHTSTVSERTNMDVKGEFLTPVLDRYIVSDSCDQLRCSEACAATGDRGVMRCWRSMGWKAKAKASYICACYTLGKL